eukprot:m.241957 g.241957  ORF g.241957 m.241957 type:complete len:820 (-) comp15831_c0_seq10:3608-6067(-)
MGSTLLLAAVAAAAGQASPPTGCGGLPWCDPDAHIDDRITSLLSVMTIAEKISQLQTSHTGPAMPGEGNASNHGYIQRLGLETYATSECLHGVLSSIANTTVFPQSISLAATWDKELLQEVGEVIGTEARGLKNGFDAGGPNGQLPNLTRTPPAVTCLSPQVNIVRDPRWGRAQETYGESPTLTGLLAKRMVAGLQGNDSTYYRVAAMPKHFDAYGGATSRHHRSPTEVTVSWRDWVETFRPVWRHLLGNDETAAAATMCSYNTLCVVDNYSQSCPGPSHGPPTCADKALLTDLLRGQWEWKGYVMSDAGAIKFIETDHEWAPSQPDAAADALAAGADLALGGGCDPSNQPPGCVSFGALGEALQRGLVNQTQIDTAVGRTLRARFRLGLMDPPTRNPYSSIPRSIVNSWKHRELAVTAAQRSVVLLQNRVQVLPILHQPASIGVVGPNAMLQAYGNYEGTNVNYTTVLEGIRRDFPSATFAPGCDMASNDTSKIAAAVAVAMSSEVTIAVMGIDTTQENEGGTRVAIELPGVQHQLLDALRETKTTLVLVLVGGSAMAIPDEKEGVDTIVWAGYGGEEAGTGLADVLFGRVVPSGRLPITFYHDTASLAPFESYNMSGGGRTFRYLQQEPLWYFGAGESYASFDYGNLVSDSPINTCGSINLSVIVTRLAVSPAIDALSADEVVEVYVATELTDAHESGGGGDTTLPSGMLPLPRLRLADFAKVRDLKVGEGRTVQFVLTPEVMAVVNPVDRAGWEVRSGKLRVWVGGRQPTIAEVQSGPRSGAVGGLLTETISLVGATRPLASCTDPTAPFLSNSKD